MARSKARITNGKWSRRVTWEQNGKWRTDMFKSVLNDDRLELAEFILLRGPTVEISVQELKRVLVGGPDHYDEKIWGPFNIDPQLRTIDGIHVEMTVIPQR